MASSIARCAPLTTRASAPTDEAQAVEALGLQPRLVRGDPDNIKITLPEDVERAALLLQSWSAT